MTVCQYKYASGLADCNPAYGCCGISLMLSIMGKNFSRQLPGKIHVCVDILWKVSPKGKSA